jgi:hypothetical protein
MVKWEDVQDDLLEAVVAVTPPLSKEQQEQIVGIMTARGHNLTWNAIRYDLLLPPKALHSLLSCLQSPTLTLVLPPRFSFLLQNSYHHSPQIEAVLDLLCNLGFKARKWARQTLTVGMRLQTSPC